MASRFQRTGKRFQREEQARALLRRASESVAEISLMIEENKAVQQNLATEAEERRRRLAGIRAEQARTDRDLDRLQRLLLDSPDLQRGAGGDDGRDQVTAER